MSNRRTNTIAFEVSAWNELVIALNDPLETAWVLIARVVGEPGATDTTLLVRSVHPVPDEAYDVRRADALSIVTAGWVPAFGLAASDEAIPVFVHTHPGGYPEHSKHDLKVDEQLARVAEVRTELEHYASLVLSGTPDEPVFAGRLKVAGGDWELLDRTRIVGERLTLLQNAVSCESAPAAIFDRQVRAFGADGQRALAQLRVGVVGAGGTGSAAIEQLVRLGVKDIVVIDPQTLADTNVTRVYGSTLNDVDLPKVDVAITHGEAIGLGTRFDPIQGGVREKSVAESLVHCDIIMGCTDDNSGRIVLGRMPQALLQLLVDCGVVIDSRGGALFEILGRVSVVTPTSACLVCMGEVDDARARAESMTPEEYTRLAAEGYAPELDTKDPAVITFTTTTASFAINELLARVLGYCDERPANRVLIRMVDRSISTTRRGILGKHRCGRPEHLAAGTSEPFLGRGWTGA